MSKKKRKKASPQKKYDNVKSYLKKLGIKKYIKEFGQDYWSEIRAGGIDPDSVMEECNPFSERCNDMYFLNESIAKKTLSIDYERIYSAIKSINDLNGFPSETNAICELGGGAGIISMWLAEKNNDSKIVVFDQSKNPLMIGKKWADKLKISNINFKQSSYQNLAESYTGEKFDLITAINAIELDLPFPKTGLKRSIKEIIVSDLSKNIVEPIKIFVECCKRLVEETGLIYINPGSANELGLLVLFESLRNNSLGIDWIHSIASKDKKCKGDCNGSDLEGVHLFIRPSLPSILKSAWEDLRTIMLSAQWSGQSITLNNADFETYLEILSDGERVLDLTIEYPDKSHENLIIVEKAGMVGFFRVNDSFVRSGMIHSAAAMFEMVMQIENGLNQIKILDQYYHPKLKSIMNKCA